MNYAAVDAALNNIVEVPVPDAATGKPMRGPVVSDAPDFVKNVLAPMVTWTETGLPVSAMPVDGTWPTGTTQYEKRRLAVHIPVWEPDVCIQCGLCSFVCPHATIRIKAYDPALLKNAPPTFKSIPAKGGKDLAGLNFTVQVAPEDCTGCGVCVSACPGRKKDAEGKKIENSRAINMFRAEPLYEKEADNYAFFLSLPTLDPSRYKINTVKGSQFAPPSLSITALAPAAERPLISNCSPSSSATVSSWETPRAAAPFTAATFPPSPTQRDLTGEGLPGPTRSSRITQNSGSAWPSPRPGSATKRSASFSSLLPGQSRGLQTFPHARQWKPERTRCYRETTAADRGAEESDRKRQIARCTAASYPGRLPDQKSRLGYGRGRLGLRHRLRRTRPRACDRRRRQPHRPRYGGLFEHGRPDVEVDSPRRKSRIRGGRENDPEKEPGAHDDVLRLRLRGPGRLRRGPGPDLAGLP